ncbi:AraC family transcriptional regulator [Bradyrhizobium sp. CCBAU 11361]|nr:AraC family transcriptional regulator [Bradyrhizobium sp. CCBAU 11361]
MAQGQRPRSFGGIPDVSYFNRVFRRRFGITPSDMRGA